MVDLITATEEVGLQLHGGKTKILRMDGSCNRTHPPLVVEGMKIEVLPEDGSTMYLGRLLSTHESQDMEIDLELSGHGRSFSLINRNSVGAASD